MHSEPRAVDPREPLVHPHHERDQIWPHRASWSGPDREGTPVVERRVEPSEEVIGRVGPRVTGAIGAARQPCADGDVAVEAIEA